MNSERVHTPRIFNARGINPYTVGIGARDEYWEGVHNSKIHHKGYRSINKGCRDTRSILGWCTPLQHSSQGV